MGYVYYNDPVGVRRAVEQFTRAATDTVASLLTLRTTLLPANLDATTAIYVGMIGSVWPRARWLVPTSAN